MNLLHLKYAVVVAETNSMTKAAEILFTAQPNLSRAIKELESGLGISIFRRSPKGIFPTPQGEEFLNYARRILSQVDAIEAMYKNGVEKTPQFSICVPSAPYIALAFGKFCKNAAARRAEIIYAEATQAKTISSVTDLGFNIGIIRCRNAQEQAIKATLKEKSMRFELICEFDPVLLMPKDHPLADHAQLDAGILQGYTEIAIADNNAPSLQLSIARKKDVDFDCARRIFVTDSSKALNLLGAVRDSFMLSSPLPVAELAQRGIVQRHYAAEGISCRDILIYRSGYALSSLDNSFIDELMKVKRSLGLKED